MKKGRETIRSLAEKKGLDPEETLIRLWEAGLEHYSDPSEAILTRDLERARQATGVTTRREARSPRYWQELLGLDDNSFDELLSELGISMSRSGRRLPKGSVGKLRRAVMSSRSQSPPTVHEDQAPDQEKARHPPLQWRVVGRERTLRLLTREEVEGIHLELVRDFARSPDPIDPPGVASSDLLESAVFRQHTAFASDSKYPTAEMAAAALMHALVHDHPFFNGNKRTALVSMIVLLDENGIMLTASEEDLFRFVLRVAQHRVVEARDDLADREVLEIARTEEVRGIFGRTRQRIFSTQVKYTDEGREAPREAVKKIRRDLGLDEEHGVDSLAFYSKSGPFPGEFIVKYRKTLKRLARL